MLSNATYNPMETAAAILKSLHRHPRFEEDALDCRACKQILIETKLARRPADREDREPPEGPPRPGRASCPRPPVSSPDDRLAASD